MAVHAQHRQVILLARRHEIQGVLGLEIGCPVSRNDNRVPVELLEQLLFR